MDPYRFGPMYGNRLPVIQPNDYAISAEYPGSRYGVPYGVNPGYGQTGLPSTFGGLYLARGGQGRPYPGIYGSELQNHRNMGAWSRMQGGGWRGW